MNSKKKIYNFINGSIKDPFSKNFSPVYDPSKGEIISEVVLSNKKDFEALINSSKKAFNLWSQITPLKRSRILSNYKNLLEKNINLFKDELLKKWKILPDFFLSSSKDKTGRKKILDYISKVNKTILFK